MHHFIKCLVKYSLIQFSNSFKILRVKYDTPEIGFILKPNVKNTIRGKQKSKSCIFMSTPGKHITEERKKKIIIMINCLKIKY